MNNSNSESPSSSDANHDNDNNDDNHTLIARERGRGVPEGATAPPAPF